MSRQTMVRRLQGCMFAHSLATVFGCPHSGPALARRGDAWWHQRHPLVPIPRACNNKWARCLTGSVLRNACLNELLMDFPALQPVWTNSLWEVLNTLGNKRCPTDQLAQALHLENGYRLPTFGSVLMRRLCGCPDWRNLGCVLAILGSTSRQFAPHRRWLRAHFLNYLVLVCMAEPCCFVRQPLYELLNNFYERDLVRDIDDWPSDFATFEQACQVINHYGDWMRCNGWITGWDFYACTLLQQHQPKQEMQRQNASLLVGPPIPVVLPPQIARRVEAVLKRHRRDQFAIGTGGAGSAWPSC